MDSTARRARAKLAADQSKLAADQNKAKTYYEKLLALSRDADGIRPEIEEAKAFLEGVNAKVSVSINPRP